MTLLFGVHLHTPWLAARRVAAGHHRPGRRRHPLRRPLGGAAGARDAAAAARAARCSPRCCWRRRGRGRARSAGSVSTGVSWLRVLGPFAAVYLVDRDRPVRAAAGDRVSAARPVGWPPRPRWLRVVGRGRPGVDRGHGVARPVGHAARPDAGQPGPPRLPAPARSPGSRSTSPSGWPPCPASCTCGGGRGRCSGTGSPPRRSRSGVVFNALTLATGMLWGRPTWGVWWTWDARLTSTALLLVLFLGYLALRRVPADPEVRARRCAVAALIAFVDVPIVHFSVVWWQTLHQGATVLNANLSPDHPRLDGLDAAPRVRRVDAGVRVDGGRALPDRGAGRPHRRRAISRSRWPSAGPRVTSTSPPSTRPTRATAAPGRVRPPSQGRTVSYVDAGYAVGLVGAVPLRDRPGRPPPPPRAGGRAVAAARPIPPTGRRRPAGERTVTDAPAIERPRPASRRRPGGAPDGGCGSSAAVLVGALVFLLVEGLGSSLDYFDTVDQALAHRAHARHLDVPPRGRRSCRAASAAPPSAPTSSSPRGPSRWRCRTPGRRPSCSSRTSRWWWSGHFAASASDALLVQPDHGEALGRLHRRPPRTG